MNGISRLLSLRHDVLAAAEEMQEQRVVFTGLKNKEPVKAISSFNLFQTPEHIAERMAKLLGPRERILEPSAGLGRLAKFAQGPVVCVDISPDCCDILRKHWETHQGDFMTMDGLGMFDGILMNPPFRLGTDVKHFFRAMEHLLPNGRIVGLCYNGTKQNAKLKPLCSTWEVLPDGSFKSEGTNASVVLLTMEK